MDFGSGEPFDDLHRSTAFRAAPKIGTVFGGRGVLFGLRLVVPHPTTESKAARSVARFGWPKNRSYGYARSLSEEYAAGSGARTSSSDRVKRLLFVVVSGIAPAKSDLAIGKGDQAMIGDSHAMSVAAEILQHIFGATEGTFQVDHPVLSKQRPQPGSEDLGLSEEFQVSREVELTIVKGLFERLDELATKDFPQHPFGKKVVVS